MWTAIEDTKRYETEDESDRSDECDESEESAIDGSDIEENYVEESKQENEKNKTKTAGNNKKKNINLKYKFHAPGFLDHALTEWMPYVVLFSALDLDLVDKSLSRVTNAYVEAAHKVTKHETLNNAVKHRLLTFAN